MPRKWSFLFLPQKKARPTWCLPDMILLCFFTWPPHRPALGPPFLRAECLFPLLPRRGQRLVVRLSPVPTHACYLREGKSCI